MLEAQEVEEEEEKEELDHGGNSTHREQRAPNLLALPRREISNLRNRGDRRDEIIDSSLTFLGLLQAAPAFHDLAPPLLFRVLCAFRIHRLGASCRDF